MYNINPPTGTKPPLSLPHFTESTRDWETGGRNFLSNTELFMEKLAKLVALFMQFLCACLSCLYRQVNTNLLMLFFIDLYSLLSLSVITDLKQKRNSHHGGSNDNVEIAADSAAKHFCAELGPRTYSTSAIHLQTSTPISRLQSRPKGV